MGSCLIQAGWTALHAERSTGLAGPKDLRNATSSHHVCQRCFEAGETVLERGAVEELRDDRPGPGLRITADHLIAADGPVRTTHVAAA